MGINPFSSDDSVCKGSFGMVKDEDGNKTKGIEMTCPGDGPDHMVVTGDKAKAQQKAEKELKKHGKSARIRDET